MANAEMRVSSSGHVILRIDEREHVLTLSEARRLIKSLTNMVENYEQMRKSRPANEVPLWFSRDTG